MDIKNAELKSQGALNKLLKNLYEKECKRSRKYLITAYVLAALLLIESLIIVYLCFELASYEEDVTITITDSSQSENYDQEINGDNGSIINGNQYNDNAVHNEKVGE